MNGIYWWTFGGMDGWTILLILVLLGIAGAFIGNAYHRRSEKIRRSTDHQCDYQPDAGISFEERIARAGMHADVKVVCGQNAFVCDRTKEKLQVQSSKNPEGVLMNFRDVSAYAVLRDGEIITREDLQGGDIAAERWLSDCERIELRLDTKNKDYPQISLVLMPFRFETAESRDYALEAAKQIAEVLDSVLAAQVNNSTLINGDLSHA